MERATSYSIDLTKYVNIYIMKMVLEHNFFSKMEGKV